MPREAPRRTRSSRGHGWHGVRRGTKDFCDGRAAGPGSAAAGRVVLTGVAPVPWRRPISGVCRGGARPHHGSDALGGADLHGHHRVGRRGFSRCARPSARHDTAGRPRSIGIPTWFYGHEPPNVFCDGIANTSPTPCEGRPARAVHRWWSSGSRRTVQEVLSGGDAALLRHRQVAGRRPGARRRRALDPHGAGVAAAHHLAQGRAFSSRLHLTDDPRRLWACSTPDGGRTRDRGRARGRCPAHLVGGSFTPDDITFGSSRKAGSWSRNDWSWCR